MTRNPINDTMQFEPGRLGFEDYFLHVTKFRRAVDHFMQQLQGIEVIKVCNVSHPSTPKAIFTKTLNSFTNYISNQIKSGNGLDCLRFTEHQPNLIRQAIAHALRDRFHFKSYNTAKYVLVLYGSSTQWLDIVFRYCIIKSLQEDFHHQRKAKQPVVLTAAGSFKCGGYFPHASGGRLHYIPTNLTEKYKVSSKNLAKEIQLINKSGLQKVVCFVLETPSAMGQNYSKDELAAIAAVLEKHPDIFWVQDWYNSGTEHNGMVNPAMIENKNVAKQGCSVISFRRDWGGAAAYANVSTLHSANLTFIKEISKQCSENYFYTHPPFSRLQSFITEVIAKEMHDSTFIADNQAYFKQQFEVYINQLCLTNEWINQQLSTNNIQYIFTLQAEAGQFGFLFFSSESMSKAQINNGTEIAELMCLYGKCRIMPTLLAPMGIGIDPVGVRINICMSNNATENSSIIQEVFARTAQLILAIEQRTLNYPQFLPLIKLLRQGKKIPLAQINKFINKLPLRS